MTGLASKNHLSPRDAQSVKNWWNRNGHFNEELYTKILEKMETILGYTANIKYKLSGMTHDNVFIKVGKFDAIHATEKDIADDEEVFYYIEDPKEIGILMDDKSDAFFVVLKATPIYEQEASKD